ncbi:MAG: type II toxin-antitoxin system HigB family toxin [Rubrivivax sp.]|nr:type II toxin-antitoxin system HigB family toxin [Rubrivivax sp.]
MRAWEVAVKAAVWTCPNDVKQTFRNADWAHSLWIFDVNRNRIAASVNYQGTTRTGVVYIKEVLTHPEYDAWTVVMTKKGKGK